MATLFLAEPNKDNFCKLHSFESDSGEEVVFAISQSRTESKTEGQDSISAVLRGRFECVVLCDGHDLHGHLVSRGICESLAPLLLEKLDKIQLDTPAAERAIIEAFDECERLVMWSNVSLSTNSFVRIVSGEWAGRVGYVSDSHDEDDTFSVIVVDRNAYHRPRLPRAALTGSRFVGGSTCVAFVRDSIANLVRVAVMGDTRAMIVNAKTGSVLAKDPIFERIQPAAFLSFPHDVFNTAELKRLRMDWYGEYEIDGPYLINPLTGCEIQPTRGFGDFDMFGTGYICTPDVSQAFPLELDSILLIASDGVFDDQVWPNFTEVVTFIQTRAEQGKDLELIALELHTETVAKAKKGDYVDDISFFMCRGPRPAASAAAAAPSPAAAAARQSNAGLPPLAPKKITVLADGVDGLPTPKSSFMSYTSFTGFDGEPRASASLSEIAAGRRISSPGRPPPAPVSPGIKPGKARASTEVDPGLGVISGSSTLKRASTSEYVDPAQPRYLKDERKKSMQQADLTVRRTRGPSYLLPEGLEVPTDKPGAADAPQIDLQTIGEESVLVANSNPSITPADTVRTAVVAAKRRLTAPSADLIRDALRGKAEAKTPAVNAILKRMAERYGRDLNELDELIKDLSVV